MKKLLLMLPLLGMLAACYTDKKCSADTTLMNSDSVTVNYEEIYAGTFPAADCSGIYYLLRFYTSESGTDTLFTLEASYLDAEGEGMHKSFTTNGKRIALDSLDAFSLYPNNGDPVMNFIVVDETTLRMVNDSLKEVGVNYDLVKVTNLPIDSCVAPTNPNIVNSEL
jgi:hypothetical protein